MTDDHAERKPQWHWPHAADACKARLDLDALEPLAVRVLARGLLSQRLVAFVGAGASAAYGRQTWRGLMRELWRVAEEAYAGNGAAHEVWTSVRKRLWDDDESVFLAADDHAVKAQVLHELLALLPGEAVSTPDADDADAMSDADDGTANASDATLLQRTTKFWLENSHGFVEWVLEQWQEGGPPAAEHRHAHRLAKRKLSQGFEKQIEQSTSDAATDGYGLLPVLTLLARVAVEMPAQKPASLHKALVRLLSRQRTGLDSPLRLLVREFGIRRYITTNYDHEIERGLEAAGFVADADAGHRRRAGAGGRVGLRHGPHVDLLQANRVSSMSFGHAQTGGALRFALEGPRRHAEVLHLHGDVAEPSSLIITEADYQRLYLDDHPRRDLVNNATLANFGANPVLFVGSDVSEDDVLRPMRQFMSGEGHRADRMAVALFVSHHSAAERARRQAKLWLKYGVYALDVGRADGVGADGETPDAELWLVRLLGVQMTLHKERQKAKTAEKVGTAFAEAAAALTALPRPTKIEGIELNTEQREQIAKQLVHVAGALREAARDGERDGLAHRRAEVQLDITVSWISGVFLCCKLIDLHDRARRAVEDDSALALSYRRPVSADRATSLRHAVLLGHPLLLDRFRWLGPKPGPAADEHLEELVQHIQASDRFRRFRGRRVVIVSGARGLGKGAQFDRLIRDLPPDGVKWTGSVALCRLMQALGHYGDGANGLPAGVRVVHANLSFSNELGPLISQVSDVMRSMRPAPQATDEPGRKDQLEMLGRGMHGLSLPDATGRLLLVLGSAGVLFDTAGRPKNGQIRRVMRTLLSPRFTQARLDILMYVGESQMPEYQRLALAGDAASGRSFGLANGTPVDLRPHRRLLRLNIESLPPRPMPEGRPQWPPVLVHPLRRTKVSELACTYFPVLSEALGWPALPDSAADDLARRLYYATGGSRLAQTLLLAWMDARCRLAVDQAPTLCRLLVEQTCAALRAAPAASAVEACVEYVLDQWAYLHRDTASRIPCLPFHPRRSGEVAPMRTAMVRLAQASGEEVWSLALELLWHLSAFSHPVEPGVLLASPRIERHVAALRASRRPCEACAPRDLVTAALELLVHDCLAFRICARPIASVAGVADTTQVPPDRIRYTVHRHIQRHFLRLMGGRNLEATAFDPYATTLYASLPDESPVLHAQVHETLVEVVRTLSAHPDARAATSESTAGAHASDDRYDAMVDQADRLRGAYYLVRSTYSLGVVSHLTAEAAARVGRLGHLEQYRRLVRWITHEARYWERRHGVRHVGAAPGRLAKNARRWSGDEKPSGVFYPGELVWLYNECGVISLAQGKLHDAEQLLTMAEIAARRVEADDTGSLHVRIRIHAALVQIERGRPQRARQMLQPIAARQHGHPVPPLLAGFYLGQLDHLGGNYTAARTRYEEALRRLREVDRSRAAAFVLMNLADVMYGLHKQTAEGSGGGRSVAEAVIAPALVVADEAISLAQQGGHEDLRMLAILGRARICIDAGRITGENLFEQLSAAERYAVLNDMPRLSCEVHELRARLLMRQGEFHMSASNATTSLEVAAMYDMKLKKARGLLTLAEIYLQRGEIDGARGLAAMGREIATSCDYAACVRGFKELELRLGRSGEPRR